MVDLKKEGPYIEHYRNIVKDFYIVKGTLELNLPPELINIIVLKICDKIIIKYENNHFRFINPYNNDILKIQSHTINNYYYIFRSLNNDDINMFFVSYKKPNQEYLDLIGDDIQSIKQELVLQYIPILPDVNLTGKEDIIYFEYLKQLYEKVNDVRKRVQAIQLSNIYEECTFQFSLDYNTFIIRNINASNKYTISVYNTATSHLISSKKLEIRYTILNDNLWTPDNKLIIIHTSKDDIMGQFISLYINIYNPLIEAEIEAEY